MWQLLVSSLICGWMMAWAIEALPAGQSQGTPLNIQLPNQGFSGNQVHHPVVQHAGSEQHPSMVSASNSHDSYSSYGGGGNNYDSNYGGDNYGFDCYGKKPAYYGDGNYDCKVYHVCQADGRSDTFRCPKWTRFNNYLGICDWHFKVDSYCNPLYKEDSYGSSYGSGSQQSYQGGSGY